MTARAWWAVVAMYLGKIRDSLTADDDADADAAPTTTTTTTTEGTNLMTPLAKVLAVRLISVFEGGRPSTPYSYIAWLSDGGGYTMGLGLLSSLGEVGEIARDAVTRGADLAAYAPALVTDWRNGGVRGLGLDGGAPDAEQHALFDARMGIAVSYGNRDDGSTFGTPTGFLAAWVAAAKTPELQGAHDAFFDRTYFAPGEQLAAKLGLTLAFSALTIIDTCLLQGAGQDSTDGAHDDTCWAVINRTTARVGGPSAAGERWWVRVFLEERRKALANPRALADGTMPKVAAQWIGSLPRADILIAIAQRADWSFESPVVETGPHFGVAFDAAKEWTP